MQLPELRQSYRFYLASLLTAPDQRYQAMPRS